MKIFLARLKLEFVLYFIKNINSNFKYKIFEKKKHYYTKYYNILKNSI